MRAGWRVDPAISGGGNFVDLGSHTLDLLDWLLGPVTQASGVAVNRGGRYLAEDVVTAAFGFASGVDGVGTWNDDSFRSRGSGRDRRDGGRRRATDTAR